MIAEGTSTLLHAGKTAGHVGDGRFTYNLVNQDGDKLTDQDGNYLVATLVESTLIIMTDATTTLVHA